MKLLMSPAPHLRSSDDVRKIMFDVILALTPATIFGIITFGFNALLLVIIGMVSAEGLEYFIMKYMRKKKDFKSNLSAATTGLLIALNCSVFVKWWQVLIGVIVAVGIAKHVFGGLGKNIWNPALVGRVFMTLSFPVAMTTWLTPFDLQTTATPLAYMKTNSIIPWNIGQAFLGTVPGCIGEVSALLLIVGFGWLVYKKRIKLMIPVAYIGTVLILSSIFYLANASFGNPLMHLFSGGLMLGALFMATDMVTSPMSIKGCMIFGIGCGVITLVIRYFGGMNEGVSFSILLMNALVPLIDSVSRKKVFGEVKKNA